ncbi:hypothetical protein RO3G_11779 [Rhizopus delemar RA 99-880]|uniref:Uncharacterized protein n=1 Tax=Rhizopus delemar (strain RA 99-880 / ATCC MYA-4621 / FGSC 9543 / NRRL 43880) TaxID=246409 RepID=I1CF38_RHIO9|nr:hypothetical protein RO3G_11779 [Rhizopus delemar RA 99-880]|eukprot:EIE87068.1 hypothetical protein RO3G_11779 [Rhizopus delemar RA 99-880]
MIVWIFDNVSSSKMKSAFFLARISASLLSKQSLTGGSNVPRKCITASGLSANLALVKRSTVGGKMVPMFLICNFKALYLWNYKW